MRTSLARSLALLSAAYIVTLLLVGCSGDDLIVFRDRAPFNSPPDAASGFLGYYNVATKQTTCGNCHSGFQAKWVGTDHANAYATLNANPAKAASCFGCHTVTGKGNAVGGTAAGHDAVKDRRILTCSARVAMDPDSGTSKGSGRASWCGRSRSSA